MSFYGFSISFPDFVERFLGFSVEDNSNLIINLVDDQTGLPVEADIFVDVDGTPIVMTGDSNYGLKVDAANITISVAESTHLPKVVPVFAHDGSERVVVTVELRKTFYYKVITKNLYGQTESAAVKLTT